MRQMALNSRHKIQLNPGAPCLLALTLAQPLRIHATLRVSAGAPFCGAGTLGSPLSHTSMTHVLLLTGTRTQARCVNVLDSTSPDLNPSWTRGSCALCCMYSPSLALQVKPCALGMESYCNPHGACVGRTVAQDPDPAPYGGTPVCHSLCVPVGMTRCCSGHKLTPPVPLHLFQVNISHFRKPTF